MDMMLKPKLKNFGSKSSVKKKGEEESEDEDWYERKDEE